MPDTTSVLNANLTVKMHLNKLVLILLIGVVYSERYTRIYYKNEPYGNVPLSRSRKYRVVEGEEDITQDSAGHRLRFAYHPQIVRSGIDRPILGYNGLKGLRESRESNPIFASSRPEIRRYDFRPQPPQHQEPLPVNSIKQHDFVINRPVFRYKLMPEDRYVVQHSLPRLHYVRRPNRIYYLDDPYQNVHEENILEDERPLKRLKLNQNERLGLYQPVQNPIQVQKYPEMIYSPRYAYSKDNVNPVPSSSHLPEYISDVGEDAEYSYYSPSYKYGGGSGGGGIGGGSGGGGIGGGSGGGGGLEKSYIEKENKKSSGNQYHEEDGKKKDEYKEDEEKFKKDEEAVKHKSSDSGQYSSEELKKKNVEDQEKYNGGKTYKQEEQNENEKKNKSTHKKGHIVRSFKNSHHKEETGNNEEYYDEEHDTGDSFKFDASAGHFGENKAEAFKGDHEQKEYSANEKLDKGSHEAAEVAEKVKEAKNENKESKEESNSKHYGNHDHKDEQSLLGHQESKSYDGYSHHIPIHRHL